MASTKRPGITYDLSHLLQLQPGKKSPRDAPWFRVPAGLRVFCFYCGVPFIRSRVSLSETGRHAVDQSAVRVFCGRSCGTRNSRQADTLRIRNRRLHRFCGTCQKKVARRSAQALWGAKAEGGQDSRDLVHRDAVFCSIPCRVAYWKDSPARAAAQSAGLVASWAKRKIDKATLYRNCICGARIELSQNNMRWAKRHNDFQACSHVCSTGVRIANMTVEKEQARLKRSGATREKRLGTKFRSTWESTFAEQLDRLGVEWTYEAITFETLLGFYTPDFTVGDLHIDIKGKGTAEQDAKADSAWRSGAARVSIVRSLTQRAPDLAAVAKLVADRRLPIGNVYL